MSTENNNEAHLLERVNTAIASKKPICIEGSGSKLFYGNRPEDVNIPMLDVSTHYGVISYEPSELVITVRAGTRLSSVNALLDEHNQQLPFDPPEFGEHATIGGCIASGLSGPRRPYSGSVRDAVLGVKIINGKGEILNFGGQVIKNVAGYDVSRLMVGAMGTLGVILEVSIRVMPKAASSVTQIQKISLGKARSKLREWARHASCMSGSAWYDGHLYTRFCGGEGAIAQGVSLVGGDQLENAANFWHQLREQQLDDFSCGDGHVWRLSVAPASDLTNLFGELKCRPVMEWGGALYWLMSPGNPDIIREAAKAAGGHATLFRVSADCALPDDGVFAPLDKINLRFHRRLKAAFDPHQIFNPQRLCLMDSPE